MGSDPEDDEAAPLGDALEELAVNLEEETTEKDHLELLFSVIESLVVWLSST